MALADIVIRGAREHNLRNVELTLPRNQLIVMTGVSGSGKSSLAFDTLYAEGQRRYVESLSSYARQFLGQMPKPEVDSITGLAPSISIQQKTSGRNPRSTVGTITEIYDYLRVLFARVGQGNCERCGKPITAQSLEQILEHVLQLPEKTRFLILSPLIQNQKGEYKDLFEDLLKQGYLRARVDGEVVQLTQDLQLDRQMKHTIEVVVDRLVAGKVPRARLAEALELALKLSNGTIIVSREVEAEAEKQDKLYSSHYACVECGISYEPPSPQLFSFNSPRGMCLDCNGLGDRHDFVLDRLIPDDSLSLMKGAIEPLGPWTGIGKWKKHIYKGAAEVIEKQCQLKKDAALKTKWSDLPEEARNLWLHGLGDKHITFSWRHSGGVWKHGGTFAGLIEELLEQYRKSNNPMKRTQLEGYMQFVTCPTCRGARLNPQARHVTLTSTSLTTGERPASAGREASHRSNGKGERPASAGREHSSLSLPGVCGLSIQESFQFFESLALSDTQKIIAEEALKEIRGRLGFLLKCGLNYLTLDRTAPTLSGGETQRIRLASQIGCGLVGVVYILDEPSIGLHPRDNEMLLESLCDLRDQGNTVIVVEHDEETMRAADYIVDFGPGPGVRGGEIVARGQYNDIIQAEKSVTGQYLSGKRTIEIPQQRRPVGEKKLKIVGAKHNNLRNVDVEFPLETFICVTGVSGSGKSSLVNDILWEVLNRDLNKGNGDPGSHDRIEGLELLDKAIDIDQSPIGRTPRSNPATYVKLLDQIRSLYTQLADAKIRGYKPGRFSFNVPGGRCEACEGHGSNKLEMDFLADIWVTCPVCQGHRFNHETLEIRYNGKNIAQVLEMDIQEGMIHFEHHPKIYQLLKTLHDVGLDYLKLGQPSPTLSGGEAQRIKLARELGKRSTGKTIYLLDEPTTGLHFADIHMLLNVLHDFVDQGNTVLVVEHNIDVLKTADWIIDIGPEGGKGGGTVIAQGTPEQIAACEHSHTGKALHAALYPKKKTAARRGAGKARGNGKGETEIVIRGAAQHNLQHLDLNIPREKMNVFCGPSGSGKSSLAMQTIYAEGQRRYVESLSAYARQFLGQMPKPRVDHIHGLSPAIAIEQKNTGTTPRSTVGTVTEVYDYLRVLYARLGQPYCPDCDIPIETQTTDEVVEKILALPEGTKALLLAPQEVAVGQSYESLWDRLKANGYARVRINGKTHRLEEVPKIDRKRKHQVEIVVDRISVSAGQRSRIADSVESGLELGKGNLLLSVVNEDLPETKWETQRYSLNYACTQCGRSFEELVPHHFSFNSPLGWCPACEGLGVEQGRGGAEDKVIDQTKSLLDGAVTLWPAPKDNPPLREMLETVCKHFKIAMDKPFGELYAGHQRMILQGTGDEWFSLRDRKKSVVAQFQYKGVYPTIEEARRVSYHYRQQFRDQTGEVACSACHGSRLRDDAAAVRLKGKTMQEVGDLSLNETLAFLQTIKLTARDRKIAGDLLTEATSRLSFLVDVGLHYLTMSRPLPTLSGGETQRIRLAGQIGRALTGVLYVLDEPTIGLHAKDNGRLIEALRKLRDLGNTLVLVEHDREVLEAADRLYDFGPGAGRFGGSIVGEGTPKQLAKRASLTGKYLSDREKIPLPLTRRMQPGQTPPGGGWLELIGAGHHNLRNVDLKIPLGTLTCITGVSGSGKSSLIEETLARAVARKLSKTGPEPGAHEDLLGVELINKLIAVDQQPLGSTPASNPATYTGVFEQIRELFASIPEAKVRGYRSGRFSFNRAGGRCESCEGNGQKCIEMHFLPDVWVTCEECNGKRYNQETLAVQYRGRSIADVLEMSISEALALFENIPKIRSYLATLEAIGLGYLTLGQSAPTLSGGEAQRVKLAAELARPNTGRTLYLLDEPTTGLHFDDIAKLLKVVNSLVEAGNTVVIIEHNLDVIKTADWVVDIGPEAGKHGGLIVAEGTPEDVVRTWVAAREGEGEKGRGGETLTRGAETNGKRKNGQATQSARPNGDIPLRSYTAELLAPLLKDEDRRERDIFDVASVSEQGDKDLSIKDVGLDAKMPWQTNGRRWHTVDRLSHAGKPVRWEGSALALVVDAIGQSDFYKEPNWNNRSIVEISTKEKNSNWFLHAMTGEEWFLKLKFRTQAGTFGMENLQKTLALKPADDLEELPIYGQRDRVRVLNSGAWQEVIVTVHWLKEIDTPAFRDFLQKAMQGYQSRIETEVSAPAEVDPWVRDGREWHTSRRGFPAARGINWTVKTLEALLDDLIDAAPEAEIDWRNKQVVNFVPAGEDQVWATVHTKRRSAIDLMLFNEPGRTTFGSIAGFGDEREVISWRDGREAVKIRLTHISQVEDKQFREFLRQHWRGQQ